MWRKYHDVATENKSFYGNGAVTRGRRPSSKTRAESGAEEGVGVDDDDGDSDNDDGADDNDNDDGNEDGDDGVMDYDEDHLGAMENDDYSSSEDIVDHCVDDDDNDDDNDNQENKHDYRTRTSEGVPAVGRDGHEQNGGGSGRGAVGAEDSDDVETSDEREVDEVGTRRKEENEKVEEQV